jgi:hypothetical protein
MIDVGFTLLAVALLAGTFVVAHRRGVTGSRVALAYGGATLGLIAASMTLCVPILIVAHGTRPAAASVALSLLPFVLAAGAGAGIVLVEPKNLRSARCAWAIAGAALATGSVVVCRPRGVLLGVVGTGAALSMLLLFPVFGWATSCRLGESPKPSSTSERELHTEASVP